MGKSIRQYMREMREAEKMGFGEMNRLRYQRLAELVAFAREKSPYYRELYRHLRERPVLSQLPVTSKAELMPHFNDWVTDRRVTYEKVNEFVNDPSKMGRLFMGKYKVALTSGTTGAPGYFLHDKEHQAIMNAWTLRAFGREVTRSDLLKVLWRGLKMATVTAGGAHFVVASNSVAMSRIPIIGRGFRLFPAQQPIGDIVAQLNEFQPTILAGYSSMIMLLSNEREAGRLNVHPVLILPSSEATPIGGAARFAKVFGGKVLLTYAATELLFLAVACREEWQHISSDWLTFEPVDENFAPVPPGALSRTVLVSNLANHVQPIIRYNLGDSILVRPDPCPCGNPHIAVRVQGRAGDLVVFSTPDGKTVALAPLQLATAIDRTPGVELFQIVQTSPTTLRVRLRCKPGADPDKGWNAVHEALKSLLHAQNAGHVTIERAQERPDNPPGKKYRTVIPFGK